MGFATGAGTNTCVWRQPFHQKEERKEEDSSPWKKAWKFEEE